MAEEQRKYAPNGYKEEHTFPNGLHIEYDSSPLSDYVKEMHAIANQIELDTLIAKWKYLIPELKDIQLEFDIFKQALNDVQLLEKFILIKEKQKYVNLIIPRSALRFVNIARHFRAPEGVAILQAWNAGIIDEMDGYWYLKEKEKNESKH